MFAFPANLKRCSWGVVAAIAAASCTTREIVRGSDLAGLPELVRAGETVRVTTAASSVMLEVVSIENGVLRGTTPTGDTVPVRLADITAVEHRTIAPGKTAGVVIGALFGAGLLAAKDSCKPTGPYGESKCDVSP